jgi:hypothetical protein
MKLITLLATIVFSNITYSQLNTLQSSNNLKWLEVESKNFKIVFPKYLEDKAQYTLNLLEHYRPLVSQSYQKEPKKLNLVIRPDMALPNGFVTLAPRRSEWFNHTNITPLVGSLEWFQSLAIHEYRHIVQYDFLNQGYTKWGYNLFGEGMLGLLVNMAMPTWYFEGDAVWAETTLSDAGRGRSPRFLSRLKALVTTNKLPKYDDLLAGDFTQNLPNHYVYGYFLITHAYNKFGKDVWKNIATHAADRPWNPYAMYNAFESVTGIGFDNFYNDSLAELKSRWGIFPKKDLIYKNTEYVENIYPIKDGKNTYHLQKGLNSHWELHSKKGFIKEFNIIPSLSKVSIKKSKFLFTQNIPHWRYTFKEFSDLFIYDIKKKKLDRITNKKRLFHPQFSNNGKKILAIEYNEDDEVGLTILDLKGEILSEHSLKIHGLQFSEATWLSNNTIAAIVINEKGEKYFATYDLDSDDLNQLTSPTRNNIYNLTTAKGYLYFEADYKGKVQIFQLGSIRKKLSKCTNEFIGAYSPFVSNSKKLSFVYESNNGRLIKEKNLKCSPLELNQLLDSKGYLGKSPSDFFHKSRPVALKKFTKFRTKVVKSKKHSEYSGLLTPHSWSFIGTRGFQLEGTTTNNLNTLGLNAYLGSSSEESTPFGGFSFIFSKLYPIFSLHYDYAQRKSELVKGQTSEWNETIKSLNMTIPYTYSKNLWSSLNSLSISSGILTLSENDYTSNTYLNDNGILTNSINLSTSFRKRQTRKDLQPKYGLSIDLKYTDLKTIEDAKINYITQFNSSIQLPSYFENHGFNLEYTQENRPEDESLYQLQTNYVPLLGYTLSRGYNYEFTSEFKKTTFEYLLPLTYLRKGYKDWIYITRIYGKLFFDSTAYLNEELNTRTLNSKGMEFFFDTLTFRKFPLTYGLRIFNTETDNKNHGEFFLSTVIN